VLQALGTIRFRFLQKKSKKKCHACVPLNRFKYKSKTCLQRTLFCLLRYVAADTCYGQYVFLKFIKAQRWTGLRLNLFRQLSGFEHKTSWKKSVLGDTSKRKFLIRLPAKKCFKKLLLQLPKGESLGEDVPCRLSARVDNHILGQDQPVEALQGEGGLHVEHHVLA
jgi:hypothetical protein